MGFSASVSFGTILLTFTLVSGCASISVEHLTPNLEPMPDRVTTGVPYYMPKPYLLVVRLPAVATDKGSATDNSGHNDMTPPHRPGSADNANPGGDSGGEGHAGGDEKEAGDSDAKPAPSGGAGDISFSFGNSIYLLKIVYLPDMRHPMAVSASGGMFGSASLQPTLQDGWMLTGMNGQVDPKVSETLTSLASLIPAIAGIPSAGGGGGGGGEPPPGGQSGAVRSHVVDEDVLPPGLYEFHYDQDGNLVGLCKMTAFRHDGPVSKGCIELDALSPPRLRRSQR